MTNKQKKAAAKLAAKNAATESVVDAAVEETVNETPVAPKVDKGGAASIKAVADAGKTAITCFPKGAIIEGLTALAAWRTAEGEAKGESGSASLHLANVAAEYGVKAHAEANDDTSTVLDHWKSSMRLVALELAASGSPFAEATTTDKGTIAKLTGTGNNVMSIAKGVVDFGVIIDECQNDDGEVSYRSVRSVVEAKRKARKAEKNPEQAALDAAKESAREAWLALSKVVFGTNDIGLINELTVMLTETAVMSQGDIDEQIAAELKAVEDASLEVQAAADAEADALMDEAVEEEVVAA